ncbi:hypothetical protein [Promicromonospora iranensis]|uniref:hypothetical protein n=1 Tax=Promicromonospora iranensis TaxID=1105144 RepID=UPI003CD0DC87
MRHYYASPRIRHGASVKAVQVRLGHKDASETLDTYWYHHGLQARRPWCNCERDLAPGSLRLVLRAGQGLKSGRAGLYAGFSRQASWPVGVPGGIGRERWNPAAHERW